MDDSIKVKNILSERIKNTDDALQKIEKAVEIVPLLQNQKEADEASLSIMNALPPDALVEIAP
jgi:hypothetical protein